MAAARSHQRSTPSRSSAARRTIDARSWGFGFGVGLAIGGAAALIMATKALQYRQALVEVTHAIEQTTRELEDLVRQRAQRQTPAGTSR